MTTIQFLIILCALSILSGNTVPQREFRIISYVIAVLFLLWALALKIGLI